MMDDPISDPHGELLDALTGDRAESADRRASQEAQRLSQEGEPDDGPRCPACDGPSADGLPCAGCTAAEGTEQDVVLL